MQYREDRKGTRLSVLGYGCLRFTRKNGRIDLEKAESEILEAIRGGVNYFDLATAEGRTFTYFGKALGDVREWIKSNRSPKGKCKPKS